MVWALVVGAVGALVAAGNGWTGWPAVLAGGVVAFVFYWVESLIWPEIQHCWNPFCRDGLIGRSPFTPGAMRRCGRCGGSGRRRRTLAGGS